MDADQVIVPSSRLPIQPIRSDNKGTVK